MSDKGFDQHIKDKLSGFNAPADPNAWAGMEALMDKPKRRLAAWWIWPIALILLLLVSFGSFYLGRLTERQKLASEQQDEYLEQRDELSGKINEDNDPRAKDPQPEQFSESELEPPATSNSSSITDEQLKDEHLQNTELGFNTDRNPTHVLNANDTGIEAPAPDQNQNISFESGSSLENAESQGLNDRNTNALLERSQLLGTSSLPFLYSFISNRAVSLEDPSKMAYDLRGEDFKKLPNPKLKEHSIGFIAWISESLSGAGLPDRPSYSFGVQYRMLTNNKRGFVSAFLYNERFMKTPNSICDDPSGNCPETYNTFLHDVQLRFGMEMDFIYREKWQWWGQSGIDMFIANKETFEYDYVEIVMDTANTTLSSSTLQNFPTQNQFEGITFAASNYDALSGSNTSEISADRFSLPGKTRLHGALFLATGLAFKPSEHLRLEGGIDYGLSFKKIGDQGTRLHNIRLRAGLSYVF